MDKRNTNIFESDVARKPDPQIINTPSGMLRRSFTTHSVSRIGYGNAPEGNIGIFAKESIRNGELIEISPLIFVSKKALKADNLGDYIYEIDAEEGMYAIALGYGSLYNHSDDPNANWNINDKKNRIHFVAIQDIQAGQQITISYGDTYWENRKTENK